MKCELCAKEATQDSRLCEECDNERLSEASLARVMSGSGLTYSNAEEYSQENWITSILQDRAEQ